MDFEKMLPLAIIAAACSMIIFSFLFVYTSHQGYNVFTGFATSATNATVNITVNSQIAINFSINSLNFGQGTVSPGSSNATVRSDQNNANNVTNGNFPGNTTGLRIQNIGNKNSTLWIGFNKTASIFLGGTAPAYRFNVTNFLAGSCNNTYGYVTLGNYSDVNATFFYNSSQNGAYICSNFSFSQANNLIRLDIELVVPSDSNNGSLGDIITASADAATS